MSRQLIKVPEWVANMPFMAKLRLTGKDLKATASKDDVKVQIIQELTDKNSKDIDNWRMGIMAADNPQNPQWQLLQDIYDYILVDAHTHSLLELRKSATLGARFYIYDATTGKEQPEKTALLQTEWFYNFLSKVLDVPARGYMVAQLLNPTTMKFGYIPHRNCVPQKDIIRLSISDEVGVDINDPALANFIINVKDSYLYGYLNDIVPLVLWKLNVLMAWAESTEKYGIPPLIATTTKSDKGSLDTIQTMLQTAAQSLTAVVPEGTKIEVMSNYEKVDPEKMFGGLLKTCDNAISKRLVGGTMISDDGSSHSQSKVHQDNFDEKIVESDKRKAEFVMTGQLLPMMAKFGYPIGENDRFAFDRSQKVSILDKATIVEKMLSFYDIDENWIKKELQIPILGKKAAPTTPPTNFKQAPLALAAALGAKGVMLPNYAGSCGHHHFPTAGLTDILGDISDELINSVFNGKETLLLEVLEAIKTSEELDKGLFEGWGERRMQLTYDATDNHCLASMEYNIFTFSRLKQKANVFALNELLIDKETNEVRNFKDFKEKATQYLTTTEGAHLSTQYNMCVAVGQNSSRYHQFVSERKTVTNFVKWQTVGDGHVRPKHAALNGKIFKLDEKGGLSMWPPKDWGCRCEMVQVIGNFDAKDIYTNAQALEALDIKPGSKWDVNRAVTEQVFTANDMYLKENELADNVNELTYDKYGRGKFNDIKKGFSKLNLDDTITQDNVGELFKKIKGTDYMGFKDYTSRNIVMQESTFNKHTTIDKYIEQGRPKFFPHIPEVLNNPDEVWLFKRGKDNYQTNYVKFYNNQALVVNTRLGEKNLEINTWYKLAADSEEAESGVRSGYLIRSKKL